MDEALDRRAPAAHRRSEHLHGEFFDLDEAVIAPPRHPDPDHRRRPLGRGRPRAGRLGDGWLGIWNSPRRFTEAVELRRQRPPRPRPDRRPGTACRSGAGSADTAEAARAALAPAMQGFYRLPFERFERYCPYGRPTDVAEFLAPYVAPGCAEFNLIPISPDVDQAIEGAAAVKKLRSLGHDGIAGRSRPGSAARRAAPTAATRAGSSPPASAARPRSRCGGRRRWPRPWRSSADGEGSVRVLDGDVPDSRGSQPAGRPGGGTPRAGHGPGRPRRRRCGSRLRAHPGEHPVPRLLRVRAGPPAPGRAGHHARAGRRPVACPPTPGIPTRSLAAAGRRACARVRLGGARLRRGHRGARGRRPGWPALRAGPVRGPPARPGAEPASRTS